MEKYEGREEPGYEQLEKLFSQFKDYRGMMMLYNGAMREIKTKVEILSEEYDAMASRNPIESIKMRLKTPQSIYRKLTEKGLSVSKENVRDNLDDVAGVRIICSFIKDIYTVAEAIISQRDVKLLELKDYIQQPKESGYRSLHLIVKTPVYLRGADHDIPVEIQIRTLAMDFWASLEHEIYYKKNHGELKEIKKDLLRCAEDVANLDQKMQEIWESLERYEKEQGEDPPL